MFHFLSSAARCEDNDERGAAGAEASAMVLVGTKREEKRGSMPCQGTPLKTALRNLLSLQGWERTGILVLRLSGYSHGMLDDGTWPSWSDTVYN